MIPLPFKANAGPRGVLLPSQPQPETRNQARAQSPIPEQGAMKCLELQRVTKCPEWMGTLTFIWSVMSHSPSMSEHYGLNGGKASDWLRLYTPKWGHVRFWGWSSINELRWTRPIRALQFLISSKLDGSEAQLTKKQAVLPMHDTLPQGIKSIRALLQKQEITNGTWRSY